ncbi:MAG: septation protein SpoVG family protein [Pirellulales bacterium]
MEITEVRIKLVDGGAERLLAFCSITIDAAFVVRDLKLIGGPAGPFVAMPSRKLCGHCHGCGFKNPLRANYCNQCGDRLQSGQAVRDDDGRMRLYADIAHPINAACREMIQKRIVAEYDTELVRARQPGYVSRYDDIDLDDPRPKR